MSTLYFFEAHNNVLANSGIDDTVQSEVPVAFNGSFVVRVPNGVRLDGNPPSTLSDLLLQKYVGLLALYPGFTNIVYDEMTDATGFVPASQAGVTLGSRGTISILGTGQAETTMVVLASTPNDCIVTWEAFDVTETNPATGTDNRLIREYDEVDASDLVVQASFNNGLNFQGVLDGTLQTIAPGVQGNQLILRITNNVASRRWLGSWAVIY